MNKLVEKLGQKLYCVNCGLNYNDQRRLAGTIECIDENTCHVYKKREKSDDCPKCAVSMIVCGDMDGSSYLKCVYCEHQEQLVDADELQEDE